MKILFVSITVPYPAVDGGRIRVLNLLKQIVSQGEDLTFVALKTKSTDSEGIKYLKDLGIDAYLIEDKINKSRFLYNISFKREPITIAKYYSNLLSQKIKSLVRENSFDIIHFEMLHAGQYLVELSERTPTLLSTQNIDSIIWKRLAKYSKSKVKNQLYLHQARKFYSYERKMFPEFNTVTCVSDIEKDILSKICPDIDIELVPNGVDIFLYKADYESEKEETLVFTGSMDWLPNEDAAIYFTKDILPLIKREIKDIEFYVVGSNPTDKVLELDKDANVIVTGNVEDIKPYIAQASVYVVPLRIGGGTRLKILEALAMGKAIVSTSIGAEGLELSDGENILIADEPEIFADSIKRLLMQKGFRRQIGIAGRRLVEDEYNWLKIGKKLINIYKKVLDRDF